MLGLHVVYGDWEIDLLFKDLPRLVSGLVCNGYAESLACHLLEGPREYQRESSFRPFGEQDQVGVSQSFALEHCYGLLAVLLRSQVGDPVHQPQKVYTLHTRLSLGFVREAGLQWQEDVWVTLLSILARDGTLITLEGLERALDLSMDCASSATTEGAVCLEA